MKLRGNGKGCPFSRDNKLRAEKAGPPKSRSSSPKGSGGKTQSDGGFTWIPKAKSAHCYCLAQVAKSALCSCDTTTAWLSAVSQRLAFNRMSSTPPGKGPGKQGEKKSGVPACAPRGWGDRG